MGYELPKELATRANRLEAIKRAKAELEAEAIVKRAQEKPKKSRKPRLRTRNGAGRKKRWSKTHIIVAADLTNQGADSPHLPDQINQVKANTGRCPTEVAADAGYCSQTNLEYLSKHGIEAFGPPDKVKHSEWQEQILIDTPSTTRY